jgi:hypothetical protein
VPTPAAGGIYCVTSGSVDGLTDELSFARGSSKQQAQPDHLLEHVCVYVVIGCVLLLLLLLLLVLLCIECILKPVRLIPEQLFSVVDVHTQLFTSSSCSRGARGRWH